MDFLHVVRRLTISRPTHPAPCGRRALHPTADQRGPRTTAVFDNTCGDLIEIANTFNRLDRRAKYSRPEERAG